MTRLYCSKGFFGTRKPWRSMIYLPITKSYILNPLLVEINNKWFKILTFIEFLFLLHTIYHQNRKKNKIKIFLYDIKSFIFCIQSFYFDHQLNAIFYFFLWEPGQLGDFYTIMLNGFHRFLMVFQYSSNNQ